MRRRRVPPSPVGFSLFPFLAVLVCTMGALIVLLVVITVQAQAESGAKRQEEIPPEFAENIEIEREMLQLRSEQLTEQRRKTEEDLALERRELSHIEHHMRELAKQNKELIEAAQQLKNLDDADHNRREDLERELARRNDEIAETRRRLDEARRQAAARQKSYAIIPYKGLNGTNRRPIYIECRADSVIIQPEGIVLTEDDFSGPLGPGNPLAAAVRSASEHFVTSGRSNSSNNSEAYPLLLVRPDGIRAYYVARKSLDSWASEFGYELVDADWNLEFGQPDPQLAEIERRAIAVARRRQKALARAAPRAYAAHTKPRFRVSPSGGGLVVDSIGDGSQRPTGGFGSPFSGRRATTSGRFGRGTENATRRSIASSATRESRSGGVADYAGRVGTDRQRAVGRRNWALPDANDDAVALSKPVRVAVSADELTIFGSGNGGEPKRIALGPRTEDSVYEIASVLSDEMDSWGPAGSGKYWRPVLMTEVPPDGAQRYAELETLLADSGLELRPRWVPDSQSPGSQSTSSQSPGSKSPSSQSPDSQSPGSRDAKGSRFGTAAQDGSHSRASAGSENAGRGQQQHYSTRQDGSPFATEQSGANASGSASRQTSHGDSSAGSQSSGQQQSTPQTMARNANLQQFGGGKSLSEDRGRDWALPEESRGSVPLTRPIRIVCRADHLAILSNDPRRPKARMIPFGLDKSRAVDELVSVLWQRVERWGTPGNGMYWRPTLILEVRPDGQKAASELEALLRDSGLELRVSYVNPPATPAAARR